jgi:restriction endonuclease S subunit
MTSRHQKTSMTDWQTVKLGDVAYEVSERVDNPSTSGDKRFVGLEHFVSGEFKIKNWGSTADLISAMKVFKAGDTLFARRNAYLKRASMVDFDGICSGDAIVLRNNEKVIDRFMPIILNTDHFWGYAIANAAGSMSKRVRVEDLMKYEFLLPRLDEQRRIADLLWAADDSTIEYQNVLSTLENVELALVAECTEPKVGWQKKQIKEFADVTYGLTVDSSRRNLEIERPYLRVANVWRNSLDLTEVKNIGFRDGDHDRYGLQLNDILVVEGHANVEEIGRAALWEGQIDGCLHQNHILRVRIRDEKAIHPKFLLTLINSPIGKSYMQSRSKSTSGLNTINSTVLNTMEVSFPSCQEQEEIIQMIIDIENTRAVVQEQVKNSLNLKKQLLSSLLGG